jgi:hypothetical protein
MSRTGIVLLGVASQVLRLRAPSRPTSATVAVYRNFGDDQGTPEFTATATLDPVDTTLAGAAGGGQTDPQRIPLTSTAGIQAEQEYLISEGGLFERVVPIEVRAGYVRVRMPLVNAYTAAATFVCAEMSAPIPDVWASDESKLSELGDMGADYRARWNLVIGGATITAYSYFDVVRVAAQHGVDIVHVNERAPGLKDSLPVEYRAESGRPLVAAAWRAVRAHFAAVSIDVNSIRESEVIDELVILRALQVLAEGGWHPKQTDWAAYMEMVSANYARFFEQHFAVTLKHRTQLHSGIQTGEQRAPAFWRK